MPTILNIFEKLIKSRTSHFLNKCNILNDNKYGFRNNLSTSAFSDVLESVYTHLENLENYVIFFLQFVDTINHYMLINNLHEIRSIELKLLKIKRSHNMIYS